MDLIRKYTANEVKNLSKVSVRTVEPITDSHNPFPVATKNVVIALEPLAPVTPPKTKTVIGADVIIATSQIIMATTNVFAGVLNIPFLPQIPATKPIAPLTTMYGSCVGLVTDVTIFVTTPVRKPIHGPHNTPVNTVQITSK